MKSKLFVFMLLTALCAGFTSCSKDDDDKSDDNYAKAIAGTYKGQILMDGLQVVPEAQIVITRDGDKQVTLKVAETVLGLNVDIACKSEVTYNDNKYAISGNTTFNMAIGEGGGTLPIPVAVSGTIDKAGKASINITVNIPGAPVTVVYDGSRK
jgi:hypothetical protein